MTNGFEISPNTTHAKIQHTYPCVVEAVTDTTIIVAAGSTSSNPTLVTSRSFCKS